MWPQNGNSDPQVDLDTAAERASKYSFFSYQCWFQSVHLSMCMMDDCVSSRRGYFYLKTSISSLIRSLWIGIRSSRHKENGSSYLTVHLPTVTTAAYGPIYVFHSGSSIISTSSRRHLYSKWTRQSRGVLRVDGGTTALLLQCGHNYHDNWERGTLW